MTREAGGLFRGLIYLIAYPAYWWVSFHVAYCSRLKPLVRSILSPPTPAQFEKMRWHIEWGDEIPPPATRFCPQWLVPLWCFIRKLLIRAKNGSGVLIAGFIVFIYFPFWMVTGRSLYTSWQAQTLFYSVFLAQCFMLITHWLIVYTHLRHKTIQVTPILMAIGLWLGLWVIELDVSRPDHWGSTKIESIEYVQPAEGIADSPHRQGIQAAPFSP